MPDRPLHLITFLGTGNYESTIYEWNGQRYETDLFPVALSKFLPEIKSASVFVTEESRQKHWPSMHRQWQGSCTPDPVQIPKGSSPDELWEIFDKVVKSVPNDCRIVFDITHAFRSIPLISVLAVAYLWSVRDIHLHCLVYGAYEAKSGEPPVAPVFDLTAMVNLLEWLAAVERFRHHLDGEPLFRLLKNIQSRARRNEPESLPTELQRIGGMINRLTEALLLGRAREVLKEAPRLAEKLKDDQLREEADRWAKPISPLLQPLGRLIDEIALGAETDLEAHYHLARFYCERRLYPLAITLLREWIVSRACQLAGIEGDNIFDRTQRAEVEKTLGRLHDCRKKDQPLPVDPPWVASLPKDLLDLWDRVPDIRNDIDHAGMSKQAKSAASLIKLVNELFQDILPVNKPAEPMSNVVFYSIAVAQPIGADAPLPPLPDIPRGALVVIEGRAPIWLYGRAWHLLHGSPAGAIAVFDPRLGAVVVASHRPDFYEGQVLDLQPPDKPPSGA